MKKVDCCICLNNNLQHYSDCRIETICKHPVCIDCFKKLSSLQLLCPLCRVPIQKLEKYSNVFILLFEILLFQLFITMN